MSTSISSEILSLIKANDKEKFDGRVKQAQADKLDFGGVILSLIRSHSHEYLDRLFGLGISPDVAIQDRRHLLSFATTTPLWHAKSCRQCEKIVTHALGINPSRPKLTVTLGKKRKVPSTEACSSKRKTPKPSLKKSADGPDYDDIPFIKTKSLEDFLKDPSNF